MENCCIYSEAETKIFDQALIQRAGRFSLEDWVVKLFKNFPTISIEWLHYKM
ncbi:hypothetical protein V6B16_03385 [Salinimicrobium catena]|uniref:hypothetical protein n=1 Tax=Salinimicrobium catena TaxID=390640 RepID=UPI002FE4947E